MSKFKEIADELDSLIKQAEWSPNAKTCLYTGLGLLRFQLNGLISEDNFYMTALGVMDLVVLMQIKAEIPGISATAKSTECSVYIGKFIERSKDQNDIYNFNKYLTKVGEGRNRSLIANFCNKVYQYSISKEFDKATDFKELGDDYNMAVTKLKKHVFMQYKEGNPEFTYRKCHELAQRACRLSFSLAQKGISSQKISEEITTFERCAKELFKGHSKAVQILLRVVATIVAIAVGIAAGFAAAGPVGAVAGGVVGAGVGLFAASKVGDGSNKLVTKVLDEAKKLNNEERDKSGNNLGLL